MLKDFVFQTEGDGACVEVSATDNLSDVRNIISDELDDEQLPPGGFAFRVNAVRLSTKQEAKKIAFELIEKGAKVELVAKARKRSAEDDGRASDSNKKAKASPVEEARPDAAASAESAVVTPVKIKREDSDSTGSLNLLGGLNTEAKKLAFDVDADATEGVFDDAERGLDDAPGINNIGHSLGKEKHEEPNDIVELDGDGSISFKGTPDEDNNSDGVLEMAMVDQENQGNQANMHEHHKESNEAKKISKQVLSAVKKILVENKDFCSPKRRDEWLEKIEDLFEKSFPQTIFGVLGNTGV